MDKNFLQQKLLEIYHAEVEIKANQKQTKGLLFFDYSADYEKLLDKATDLLEKCIREDVRDDD